MKKIIIALLALCIAISMVLPASAITTGQWDFEAGQRSAQQAAENALRQETAEEVPEPDTSWVDWLHRWISWWDTVRN